MTDTEEIRLVTRAHVIAWREQLETRELAPATIRRKLSAISSLFDFLCEKNAVIHNPVNGIKRPMSNCNEGSTPALSDSHTQKLLDTPPADTRKGKRDRAILATLLYHGLRREELCKLKVKDLQSREGVLHLRIHGKGSKIRFVPLHPMAQRLIEDYLIRHRVAGRDQRFPSTSRYDLLRFQNFNTSTGFMRKRCPLPGNNSRTPSLRLASASSSGLNQSRS